MNGCLLTGVLGLGLFFCAQAECAVTFQVKGEVTSGKILSVFAYIADGEITAEDFFREDVPIGEVVLSTGGDAFANVTLDFDVTAFFDSLPEGTEWIGFHLRESESDGSIVTIEYLVLGTFLALALIVGVAEIESNDVNDINTSVLPQDIHNPPGSLDFQGVVEFQVTQAVPEPVSSSIWALGAFVAALLRRGWCRPFTNPGRVAVFSAA